ncbi:MAG: hypothetical protein ACRC92_18790 [Peptostreptococcaceae bacterium]
MKLTQMQLNDRVLYGAPKDMPEDSFKAFKRHQKRLAKLIKADHREALRLAKEHPNLYLMENHDTYTIYSLNDFNKTCKSINGFKIEKNWRTYITTYNGKGGMLTLYLILSALRNMKDDVDEYKYSGGTISGGIKLGVHNYDNISPELIKEMAGVVVNVGKK